MRAAESRALLRSASRRPLIASVRPLEAWWGNGQPISAAPPQRAAELGEFSECVGDTTAQRVDDRRHYGLVRRRSGVCVGGDEALVDAPAQFDGDVGLVGENSFQPCLLTRAQQRDRVRRVRRTP